MKTDTGGHVHYRLRFAGRSDLDSDDFRSVKVYDAGDQFGPAGQFEHGDWLVFAIEDGGLEEPDTLALEPANLRALEPADPG